VKILFAIQGTGNGHLSRARDVYPELCRHADVDVLISGVQADVAVPFPVRYKLHGLSFIFGKHGGVDMWGTFRTIRMGQIVRDMRLINIKQYDLVVNDFEPVSAWAARVKKIPCISLSHQWAVLHPQAPKPAEADWRGSLVLKHYAPCKTGYGFHFKSYGRKIYTPVIRKEIRELMPSNEGHITVYLPAYDDATLTPFLNYFSDTQWQVFSKHCKEAHTVQNVHFQPIENEAFISSMAASDGVLCGAGFEGPAEAMFLGKKVMVVPMQDQYEQQCNAAAIASIGVPVIKKISAKYYDRIHFWLSGAVKPVAVEYPDQIGAIVDEMIQDFQKAQTTVQ